MHRLTHACLLLACLSAPAFGQWSAFGDGDLLSRPNGSSSDGALVRVDPLAETSMVLIEDCFNGYSAGTWMAYEPFRDALLVYTSRLSTGPFSPSLLLVRADGVVVDLGQAGEKISALAPVGDGRVFCTANRVLSVIDRLGVRQDVVDLGGQPVTVPVDHLHYDAATNSLVGVARTGYPGTCTAFGEIGLHRYELDAGGATLRSAPTCSTYSHGAEGIPIGLDPLPGGELLLTLNGNSSAGAQMLRLNPQTLAVSTYADPSSNDKDGGVWSQALGTAVILEDTGNTFRAFAPGSSGSGIEVLAGLVPGDSTTGVSTTFEMTDVERPAGACPGDAIDFGVGLGGTGGLVPQIYAGACPRTGSVLPIAITDGLPGTLGVLLVGRQGGALPLFGGTLYVLPTYAAQVVFASDAAGAAQVDLPVPQLPALVGVSYFLQAGLADPAGPAGVSLSAGLEVVIG